MADEEEIKQSEIPEKEEKEEKKGKKKKKEKKEKKDKKGKKEEKGEKDGKKTETDEKKSLIARLLPIVIIVIVVVIFTGTGFTLGRLIAGSPASQTAGAAEQNQSENMDAENSEGSWYYHLEPVIANLDVDDVTRYVKASLTLEISVDVDVKEGTAFIDEKKPILRNWLTIYLASLRLEDIKGDRNYKRIQSQVLDAFNEKLFPDSKPKIKNILFKEFAVQ
ncbi:MAG: flagellar basal body-associated FliL family protein [Planctomycetota bacterium]|jgi:flagellar basal body-associated protein FliL